MMASGIEIYIIEINPSEGRVEFKHIVDDGEHGNDLIKEEIENESIDKKHK